MNTLKQQKDGRWMLNDTIECREWTERKTVKGKEFTKEWIVLPKDNGTGRTFIARKDADKPFENKLTGPRTIGSRLTVEAQKRIQELHDEIMRIKADPANQIVREKVDPNSEEGLKAAIERYQAKLQALKGGK